MTNSDSATSLLGIPDQYSDTGIETRPKAIEKWISSLPRANVGEMAKLVYKTLYNLNRTQISESNRYKILELFSEPTDFLALHLKKHYLGLAFPLAQKKQQVALLAREIESEIAVGYKIIVENSMIDSKTRLNKNLLVQSSYFAMHYMSKVLLLSYQIYVPAPTGLWKQIYRLYQLTHQHDFHQIPVDKIQQYSAEPTIENLFKQILLLSLASPYRLRQGDIEKVDVFLEHWGSYSELNENIDPEQHAGMFSADLSGDDAPGFFNPNDTGSSYLRILETRNLVAAIKDDIKHYSSYVASYGGNKNKILSKKVLKRLYLTWSGIAKRGFSRSPNNVKVLVTFGLSSTHHIIYENMKAAIEEDIKNKTQSDSDTDIQVKNIWPPVKPGGPDNKKEEKKLPEEYANLDLVEPEYDQKSKFNSTPSFGIAQPQSSKQDVWNQFHSSNTVAYDDTLFSFSTGNSGPESYNSKATSVKYETHICKRVNESASGYCLSWQSNTNQASPINALVGELVGIRELSENEEPQWGVGVIRWMKHTASKQLELGIQKIAPHAISAGTHVVKNIKVPGTYLRTLVLPEIKMINQPMTLISPTHYSVGNILSLSIFGDKILVKLTKLQESTGAFSHFQFSTLSDEENTFGDQENPSLDFDDVWSSIK